ncbi:hypothetical protein ACSLNV_28840, partial [Escherichia coli]|uniref:hypothetical protein n=1 Tax=Escherichia coli TaxID=562 RepID=UPI003EDFD17C
HLLTEKGCHFSNVLLFVVDGRLKAHPGNNNFALFASGRAMQRFLDYVTDLRLMLLVQGDQPRYRLV